MDETQSSLPEAKKVVCPKTLQKTGCANDDNRLETIRGAYEALLEGSTEVTYPLLSQASGMSEMVIRSLYKKYPGVVRNMPVKTRWLACGK